MPQVLLFPKHDYAVTSRISISPIATSKGPSPPRTWHRTRGTTVGLFVLGSATWMPVVASAQEHNLAQSRYAFGWPRFRR